MVVSRDGPQVFLYAGAGTGEQVQAAEKLISSLAVEEGWQLDSDIKRWHEASATWEDVEKPVPEDDAARAAEHARLIAAEREQVGQTGTPEFEVRVECPSRADRADAEQVVAKLREKGRPSVRRAALATARASQGSRAWSSSGRSVGPGRTPSTFSTRSSARR